MIHRREDFGLWWPDHDQLPDRVHAYLQAHLADMDSALGRCAHKRVCLQAGGHVGLWPLRLAGHFEQVITFEPEPALFRCLRKNIQGARNITAHQRALGAHAGWVRLLPADQSGSWSVSPDGHADLTVPQVSVDSLRLPVLDALLLDVERYEPQVLAGARETLRRCRPVVQVELLSGTKSRAHADLESMGYRLVERISRDGVYLPC